MHCYVFTILRAGFACPAAWWVCWLNAYRACLLWCCYFKFAFILYLPALPFCLPFLSFGVSLGDVSCAPPRDHAMPPLYLFFARRPACAACCTCRHCCRAFAVSGNGFVATPPALGWFTQLPRQRRFCGFLQFLSAFTIRAVALPFLDLRLQRAACRTRYALGFLYHCRYLISARTDAAPAAFSAFKPSVFTAICMRSFCSVKRQRHL